MKLNEHKNTKICPKCKIRKSLKKFWNSKNRRDKVQVYCIECLKKPKSFENIFRDQLKEQNKKKCPNCKKIKDKTEFYNNKSRHDNINSYCKLCENILNKERNLKNIKKIRIYHKKWYQENKIRILKQQKIYEKEKYKKDIRYKLKKNLRGRIFQSIKGNDKSLNTMFLIGCEIDYFMFHIQNQFTNDMSWDNYGDWHIDHIKPCASFDLSKPVEQRKCFHFKNLQPLWAEDNNKKRAKYEKSI